MTGFKGIRGVKNLLNRFKTKRVSVTGSETDKQHSTYLSKLSFLQKHKWPLLYGASALTLAGAIIVAGNIYVAKNMDEVYRVKFGNQEIGIVSDNKLIDDYKITKKLEVQSNNPDVRMIVNTDEITYTPERAFKAATDDQGVISELNAILIPQAVGVELKVDEKLIAVVKDQQTAEQILAQIKEPYLPKPKEPGKAVVLSADAMTDLNDAPSELQAVEFMQKVETAEVPIDPIELADPQEVIAKLQTGDAKPTKYKVKQGDCVSCIAKKFGISKQFIYEKNTWIHDDMIKVGDELDLTVLQPALSVKTVEKVVENHEIQYDTEYVKDDSLRAGVINPISPGKNGLKLVTYEVTKVNGEMVEETLLNEDVVEQPVTAKAKKGTKVVVGEGSGKFSWPVVSPSISSTFGMRWGKFHKGIDITGNKNIIAADNGKVMETGYKSDYGNYIIINHMNGYQTLYGHLSKISTSEGKIVEKGEKIGVMGSTGDSTGVHLHFEIIKSGNVQNPLKYLNR